MLSLLRASRIAILAYVVYRTWIFIDVLAGALQDAAIRSLKQTAETATMHVSARLTGTLLDLLFTTATGTTTPMVGNPTTSLLLKSVPQALRSSMWDAGPMLS